jgi:succinoglycan biosynthesis transport protein ExoP
MKAEVIDLRILTEVVWPHKYAILLTSLLFAALAYGLSGMLPLRFTDSGLLMVDEPVSQQDAAMSRATDSDVLRSPSLLASVVDALRLGDRPDLAPRFRLPKIIADKLKTASAATVTAAGRRTAALDYLQRHLTVSGTADSRVMSINFDAGNPELAASVINELMRQYIDADYQAQRASATRANAWLADQARAAERDADAADQIVLAFEAKSSFGALQDGSVTALDLSQQLAQLYSAKQDVIQAQLGLENAKADMGQGESSSPTAQMLRQQQTDVVQRLASAGASMGNDNPGRVALEDELGAIQRQIDLDNHNSVAAMAQRLSIAKAELASVQSDIAKSSAAAAQASESKFTLERLMQVAQSKRAAYTALLDRLQAGEFAANQTTTARVVSLAVPPLKAEPSRTPINVVLGLLTGALLAVANALSCHLFNARIVSSATLSRLSGVPTAGILPVLGSGRNRLTRLAMDQPSCAVAETLRGIRLAVNATSTTTSGNVVLVSSAARGEGKTSVAAALALRAADDGMRVLLIEGDLHRPRLAAELGLAPRANGLESVLSGGSYPESVLQTHPSSGLHCLLATGSARNPIVLLEGKRFTRLIADSRSIYDLIVIDSPPVLRVADPVLLSRAADQIVLVVREGRTPQRDVIEAISRFSIDRQSLLMTLLVGARTGRSGAHGYYSGYEKRRSSDMIRHLPAVSPQGDGRRLPPPEPGISAKRLWRSW